MIFIAIIFAVIIGFAMYEEAYQEKKRRDRATRLAARLNSPKSPEKYPKFVRSA